MDVGKGQLHWDLRKDERVVPMDGINARYLDPKDFPDVPSFATVDASFISLTKILPAVTHVLASGGHIVSLIKPQFEAGREQVGKKGVVKDPSVHEDVILRVASFAQGIGLVPKNVSFSPITGPEGNIEYLLYLSKSADLQADFTMKVSQTVEAAHQTLQPIRR